MRKDELFFCTVTPCCETVCGSSGAAVLTRFCTSTWARFTSVPMSKEMVRL